MDAARAWAIERLRFPQRSPRTTAVFDWTSVSSSTQSAFAALSTTIVDPNELVAQTSWWCTLTRKPREEGPEIRLVVVAENVVARIISDPSWTHPELHMIASAAHGLLRLRSNTPTLPIDDGTDQLARARAESDRRHVVAAQAEAALVDRIAALRAYEEAALTPIGAALNNLQAVTDLAAGEGRWIESSGRSPAPNTPSVTPLPCETASTTSEPQVTYLDSLIGPHRNA